MAQQYQGCIHLSCLFGFVDVDFDDSLPHLCTIGVSYIQLMSVKVVLGNCSFNRFMTWMQPSVSDCFIHAELRSQSVKASCCSGERLQDTGGSGRVGWRVVNSLQKLLTSTDSLIFGRNGGLIFFASSASQSIVF